MNQNEVINEILRLEWPMFSGVNNAGGKAACQMDSDTFKIMRTSQYQTWRQDTLESYLADLQRAQEQGRNLMTEKYARMMESTFPEEYARIADSLPRLAADTVRRIDEIVAVHVAWKEALDAKYPHLGDRSRPIRTRDDKAGLPSVETYTRGELQTYSDKTIDLYHRDTMQRAARHESEAEENLLHQVRQYGFSDLEAAEAYFAAHQ